MARSRDNWNIAQCGMSPPDGRRSDDKRAAGLIPAGCIGPPGSLFTEAQRLPPPPPPNYMYITT